MQTAQTSNYRKGESNIADGKDSNYFVCQYVASVAMLCWMCCVCLFGILANLMGKMCVVFSVCCWVMCWMCIDVSLLMCGVLICLRMGMMCVYVVVCGRVGCVRMGWVRCDVVLVLEFCFILLEANAHM